MGKKACVLPKYVRQELVIQVLENFSKDEGLTTKEIADLIEEHSPVCTRTIYRDLEELSLRFPITDHMSGGKKTWRMVRSSHYKDEISRFRSEALNKLIQILDLKARLL